MEEVTLYKGSRSMQVPASDVQRWINRGWQTTPPEGVEVEGQFEEE